MRIKFKILVLMSVLIFASIASNVSARTITSYLATTGDKSITVGTGFAVPVWVDGNTCTRPVNKYGFGGCPNSKRYYAESVVINGVIQGTVNIACNPNNFLIRSCAHFIYKTTAYKCTYTTSVRTWGACSASGIQYATSYNYATVAGTSCRDLAPTARACVPPNRPPASPIITGSTFWGD